MTILTADGSFARAYMSVYDAEVVSFRDLSEKEFIDQISRATTIINNAATINSSDLSLCVERNFDFTHYLVKTLENVNPNVRLVQLSSMSILNSANDSEYENVMKMTPYAYSKYLAETYCLKSNLTDVNCVRFSTLFFSDPAKDGLSKLIIDAVTDNQVTIYNGGLARRNFLPLEIAVNYVHKITQMKSIDKNTFNLAAPNSTSFIEVVNIIKKYVPDLLVNDTKSDVVMPVLSNFNMASIEKLGPIEFSLEDYVIKYIEQRRS